MPRTAKPAQSYVRMGVVLAAMALLSACASVPADLQNSHLALQRGGFSGAKYTLDGSEPDGVYTFIGTYNSSFTEVLSQQPDALAEARSAEGFMYVNLGITVLSSLYAVSELVAAANTDNDSLAGLSTQEDHLMRAMGAAVGMVIWNAILGIPIRNRLYNSVRTFNAGASSPDSDATGPGLAERLLPRSLSVNPVTRQMDVGWTLRR